MNNKTNDFYRSLPYNALEDYNSFRIDKMSESFSVDLDYFKIFYDLKDYVVLPDTENSEIINAEYVIPGFIREDLSVRNAKRSISENEINQNRLEYLKIQVTPLFISFIKDEEFEFGQKSESIEIVERELNINKIAVQHWLNDLYLQNFSKDEKILIGILRIIEYFKEDVLYPISKTIALASLVNKSDEVKEICVRIFENWGSLESYEILKGVNSDTKWLKMYIDQVIKDIEKKLCHF